jgi:hypothetical protein
MLVRISATAAFGGLAIVLAILQVAALIAATRQKRGYSFVPFLGALLWIAACLVAPWKQSWYALPLFLVVDPTPVLFLVAALKGSFSK